MINSFIKSKYGSELRNVTFKRRGFNEALMKCFICTELCGYYLESQKTKASPHSLRKSQCNSGKKQRVCYLTSWKIKAKVRGAFTI